MTDDARDREHPFMLHLNEWRLPGTARSTSDDRNGARSRPPPTYFPPLDPAAAPSHLPQAHSGEPSR